MNMLMDNLQHNAHVAITQRGSPSQRTELRISTTPPSPHLAHRHNNSNGSNSNSNNNHNNNNDAQITPATNLTTSKATLKRSFDVAFLMMPDERIKQKQQQAEKQVRLTESLDRQQLQALYPTDLSPRAQQQQLQQHQTTQQPPQSHTPPEHFNLLETRRYSQLSIRSPRIYDDPSVIIPLDSDSPPLIKSAFTKVSSSASSSTSSRLESPVECTVPPLSPDQLSCHSISPPAATPPPRTNSGGNSSMPNGILPSSNTLPTNPIIYHNFRPEYQFNGAFQSVNQMQALQAQRIKQHLLYRPPLNVPVTTSSNNGVPTTVAPTQPPSEFLHAYPGFSLPLPPGAAAAAPPPGHPFTVVTQPELPRIVQNPAAAAILSTLIPPTLASTFSLTAQNVCAKCNISFRMTSDLVYHMRSHHKSEVACDPNRRKREEKLRCPVCQETFRERHHLTRHMTAHQDKASDQPATDGADNEIINVVGLNSSATTNGRHQSLRTPSTINK